MWVRMGSAHLSFAYAECRFSCDYSREGVNIYRLTSMAIKNANILTVLQLGDTKTVGLYLLVSASLSVLSTIRQREAYRGQGRAKLILNVP